MTCKNSSDFFELISKALPETIQDNCVNIFFKYFRQRLLKSTHLKKENCLEWFSSCFIR